jgi:hypothetical protein
LAKPRATLFDLLHYNQLHSLQPLHNVRVVHANIGSCLICLIGSQQQRQPGLQQLLPVCCASQHTPLIKVVHHLLACDGLLLLLLLLLWLHIQEPHRAEDG